MCNEIQILTYLRKYEAQPGARARRMDASIFGDETTRNYEKERMPG